MNKIYYIDFEMVNTTENTLDVVSAKNKSIKQFPIYYCIGTLDEKDSETFRINIDEINLDIKKMWSQIIQKFLMK